MRNPLRSEAEAYRFLLLTVGYFALIVLASTLGGRWVGLAVFLALTVAVAAMVLRRRSPEAPTELEVPRRGAEDVRRILVLANETVGGDELLGCIRSRAEGYREQVLVVSPALNPRLRHWVSDEDRARVEARTRLDDSLARLAGWGVDARGEVGDAEPLQALEDAVRSFGPDEIIISTHPEGRSHWLERGVVEGARQRFSVPVTHVVVDLDADERRDAR